MSKDRASQFGADVSEWCLYHKVDLQSHIESNKNNTLIAKSAMRTVQNETNKKLN